ncbi:MaoC family dehydratase N-terminal domain-containing protein [Phenylobacterium sp. SCN 70-31]|uniref:FAS1-like dehydratase domain-containing protein n=1 Tax=Phenylobacterium sp. SCN 70-31 TaxID=1660129 RepID=UPI00086B350C|nr:MaoC family dehydratase N-terminal domain-containing protein [Phenylobacterium sp. SCN 70-31]ODT88316.1 MAG: hypothetical protein ABS78_06745 [Phenylobacterium sp. SCN 70-31]
MSTTEVDWEHGKITAAGIAQMRAEIGIMHRVPGWNRTVTRDSIEHFALGIGDDNPLWWDEARRVDGRFVTPPCYLYSHLRGPRLHGGTIAIERYLPGVMGVWSAENWRWNRRVLEGETIYGESGLADVILVPSRFGGQSVTQVERINMIADGGEVVASCDHFIRRFERDQIRSRGSYLERPETRYTAADRARFLEQYEWETTARRGAEPRFVEDVKVGDTVGPLLKGPLTVTGLIGFLMGAGCPLILSNRIGARYLAERPGSGMVHPETGVPDTIEAPHWDRALARASGMPDGYDWGGTRVCWLSHAFTDWAGDDGFLQSMDVKLLKPNILGDVTWIRGAVTAVDADTATIELTATNQLDEATAAATGVVRLPRRAE